VGEAALDDALSQGRVLAGVELRLVHPETGAAVPHDGRSIGELELRGPWITASYLSEADPGKFHDGWLRTGDIGTLDPDGYDKRLLRSQYAAGHLAVVELGPRRPAASR
jgi:fatty-acyl-CoA synthase